MIPNEEVLITISHLDTLKEPHYQNTELKEEVELGQEELLLEMKTLLKK